MSATLLLIASIAVQDGSFQLRAARTGDPPTIDGAVAAEEWADAVVASGFIQYEPRRGTSSDVLTEALVLYDDGYLYVAFRVHDTEPVTARLTRRDADLDSDDAVVLLLDSFGDRQSAYYFMTNALGTQSDGRVANDGRTVDDTWDAPWDAAARMTDYGWSTEMRIPFSSIRYEAGEDITWGINFGRNRRRTLEVSFWAGPLDNVFRISQAGTLVGLNIPPPARRHRAIVYGLSRVQDDTTNVWDLGGDLRVTLTPGVIANATINPDFATIEADQERINLTRFELSLPEKRPFFLENAELYRQRIRTFYSRRIPDIQGGAQVFGKMGPWTVAALGARSDPPAGTQRGMYSVSRFQRDLGPSSLALTVANRSLSGDQQGSAGLDATLFFTKTFGFTGQLIRSWGPNAPTGTWAYFLRPSYDAPTGHFHVRYTHLGDRFADNVNAVGFIRDDDRRELDAALEKTFWIRRFVERLQYDSNYNIYWSQRGMLRSWQIDESIDLEFRNRFNVRVAHTEEFKRFEADFRNRQTTLDIGYNTREFQSASGGIAFGRNFGADFVLITAAGGYKVTDDLSVEMEIQRLALDPDPNRESTWIPVIRANQFFTRDLFIRVFFQANSAIDRRNLQAVFVYRYRPPFGTVQLAFQRGTAEFGERSEQGNTLFVKATAVF